MDAFAYDLLEKIKKPKLTFDLMPLDKEPEITIISHIGGKPYIEKHEHPPLCHCCKKKMPFVFQLNVPSSDKECTLYVFYYCFQCNKIEGNKGFSVLQYKNPSLERANPLADTSKVTYSHFEFEFYWSLPNWEALTILHPDVADYFFEQDKEEFDIIYEESKEDFLDSLNFDTFSFYGGYPNFLNKPVFPSCDCCNKTMKPWIQVDSYDELSFHWKNLGVLHVFQCINGNDNFKILIE
ncbi:hypothetical protein CN918_26980 [Priestia megaterium]|nr:hypothetical protein CN918_26980 [Priestia megaterium]